MSIAEKLDSSQKIRVCGLDDLDVLITELDPEHQRLAPYRNLNLEIM
nr:hypothetical protein [Haliscomenobacter sp.]